ncbi:hypothetical protein OIU76_003759 [Salix suchowensis]|uniref:Uncharacterized protein n=3 Tax=Salix TaxID=40685 RepID=A0A9Q0PVE4_9ROSI|nr:hypothetical protein OIU76_003759 [Salix suchowensis]KAJ6695141.1 hypothetical protein OIU74_014307 [Salix koriyanagi]
MLIPCYNGDQTQRQRIRGMSSSQISVLKEKHQRSSNSTGRLNRSSQNINSFDFIQMNSIEINP